MFFLAPLFFLGLGAIAVPILVHLVQRERKHVVAFPSLMFVRRIPYQSVRRRRIRHWYLLLMRAAALALIIAGFARPFFRQGAAALAAAAGGSREMVILLDQSASMGYGDHWERARTAARDAIRSLSGDDKATLVLFGRNAEENMRATPDRGRLEAALNAAKVTSGATRYGPALKLAESILARSTLPRREAILISDFQRVGWSGAEDIHYGGGMRLTTVSVASEKTSNLSVPSVTFARASFSGQERITITAGVTNKGADPATSVPVSLEIEGRQQESQSARVAPNASTSVTFAQFTLAEPAVRGTVRAGTDLLPADNAFHFVLTPSQAVPVLLIESGDRGDASFFLSKALGIGSAPAFQVEAVPAARVTSAMIDKRSVVILNDAMVPPGVAGGVLRRYVERGGGLLVAFGSHTAWPTSEADLLPGRLGAMVDRADGRGATLGFLDYSHPVFEVFKAPRSGDFSAARVLRYRALQTGPEDRVLARYDDGAVAAAEKRIGTGRVIAWTTTLDDSWADLPRKPVYLPLVQQLARYLARYEQPSAWFTVGQVVDLSALLKSRTDRVVVTPANERLRISSAEPGLLELNEQGIYEIRSATGGGNRPDRIAVNLDPAESDLTPLDPQELVAAVTGHAEQTTTEAPAPALMKPEDAERRQGLWWYLLAAGLVLLASEMAVSNYLSRNERFL
jgi:Aerotolerance regulator N-terminal/von Willebrand factor type A domain